MEPLTAALRDLRKKRAAVAAAACFAAAVRLRASLWLLAGSASSCAFVAVRVTCVSQLRKHKKRVPPDEIVALLPTLLNHTDSQISAAGVDLIVALRVPYKTQVVHCAVRTVGFQPATVACRRHPRCRARPRRPRH
jgi:hypothetical protein